MIKVYVKLARGEMKATGEWACQKNESTVLECFDQAVRRVNTPKVWSEGGRERLAGLERS